MAGVVCTCPSGALLRSKASENHGVSMVQYDGLRLAHRMQMPSAARYISVSGKTLSSFLLILVFYLAYKWKHVPL